MFYKKALSIFFLLKIFYFNSYSNPVGIDIVYACDSKYVMPTIVSMESAIKHMKDTSFYKFTILVSPDVTQEDREKFRSFKIDYSCKCSVKIINMENAYSGSYVPKSWSVAMYYRLDIPFKLQDKDKVIYLDSDTYVCQDLQEMWSIDLEGNLCAGIIDMTDRTVSIKNFDTNADIYINSGVLLINCAGWRKEEKIKENIEKYSNAKNRFKYPDQDILNIVCAGRIKQLDSKFMNGGFKFSYTPNANLSLSNKMSQESNNDPVIIHYFGDEKPWKSNTGSSKFNNKWRDLFSKIREKYNFEKLNLNDANLEHSGSTGKQGCCCKRN